MKSGGIALGWKILAETWLSMVLFVSQSKSDMNAVTLTHQKKVEQIHTSASAASVWVSSFVM